MDDRDDTPRSTPDPAEGRSGLDPNARICGNCMVWRCTHQNDKGQWVGSCRFMAYRGDLSARAAPCDRFIKRGGPMPVAAPPERSRRSRTISGGGPVIRKAGSSARIQAGSTGERAIDPDFRPIIDDPDSEALEMTKQELLEVLEDFFTAGPIPRVANKWEGGKLVIAPGDGSSAPKEVPLDVFFKKLVRVRDQLRLLEQKINGNERLTGSDKLELQAYLTRAYGTMTTFNVLFGDSADRFVGEKSGH